MKPKKYIGQIVCGGVAWGKIQVLKKGTLQISKKKIDAPQKEIQKVKTACIKSSYQLKTLKEDAEKEVGKENARIFEVHQMLLEDEEYRTMIDKKIAEENVNAEYAVEQTGKELAALFGDIEDEYMAARAADILDISDRLIRNILNLDEVQFRIKEPAIVVADDLTPSETIQMDKKKILAFVTVQGSAASHTAILARSMNIPALVKVPLTIEERWSGTPAIVNGFSGEFIIEPDKEQLRAVRSVIERG